MKANLLAFVLLAVFHVSNSWVIPKIDKKGAASIAFVSAAICSAPLLASAVDFNGYYEDPFHPNCIRLVEVQGKTLLLSGTDGNPGCPVDGSGNPWKLNGQILTEDRILVDFTGKGGPKDVKGLWEDGDAPGIRWPDGNKWTRKN